MMKYYRTVSHRSVGLDIMAADCILSMHRFAKLPSNRYEIRRKTEDKLLAEPHHSHHFDNFRWILQNLVDILSVIKETCLPFMVIIWKAFYRRNTHFFFRSVVAIGSICIDRTKSALQHIEIVVPNKEKKRDEKEMKKKQITNIHSIQKGSRANKRVDVVLIKIGKFQK